MKLFFAAFPVLIATQLNAAADYTLIKDILGSYPLLELNGSTRVSGRLDVVATDGGVGFVLTPLKMGTEIAPNENIITPKESTVLTRENNLITQQFRAGGATVKIQYEIHDGYFTVDSEVTTTLGIKITRAIATQGKSPGDKLDPKVFMERIQGEYVIELAGGSKPKPDIKTAIVDLEGDPTEGAIHVPYCPSSGPCDGGYQSFPYDSTRVFQRITEDSNLYVILKGSGTKTIYYSWEDKQGIITFRNFQYRIFGSEENVCLEHVMY